MIARCAVRNKERKGVRGGFKRGQIYFVVTLIRGALQRGQLTGNDRFADQVEQIIGRRVEMRGPGRPAKDKGGIEK